jgi:hypothetical protein
MLLKLAHLLLMILTLFSVDLRQCLSSKCNVLVKQVLDDIRGKSDSVLIPKYFSRVENGFMVVAVNEQDGEDNGGRTNPEGSYGQYLFDSKSVLPDKACGIPDRYGHSYCRDNGLTGSFMIGPADAIVFVGCTPPPLRYFSFDFIITTRFDHLGYPFYPGVNFGDTVNFRNVNTSTLDSQSVFDKPVIIIHTADRNTATLISDSMINEAGIDASIISVHALDCR